MPSLFGGGILRTPHFARRPEPPWALNKDSPQAEGLVAWWPMGILGTYYDYSGRQNHITTSTAPTVSGTTEFGTVLSFNGSTQFLQVSPAFVTAVPLTFAAWIMSNGSADQDVISISDQGSDTRFFSLRHVQAAAAGAIRAQARDNSSSGTADTSATLPAGTWGHAGAVFETISSRWAYLNGRNQVQNTTSATPNLLDVVSVGRLDRTTDIWFNGDIADARIYDVAKTSVEMWQLFDPATRWDMYYPLRTRIFSFGEEVAAPAVTPKRLTLLGVG